MWKSAYVGVYQLLNWKIHSETLKRDTTCSTFFTIKSIHFGLMSLYKSESVCQWTQTTQYRQRTSNVTSSRVRVIIVAMERQFKIYECICSHALVIRHAKRMRRILLPSVAFLAVPYFYTSSDKRHDFREKSYWTSNVFSDFLYNFYLKYF